MPTTRYTLSQAARLLNKDFAGRMYSVAEASKRLDISESHCRRLLKAGKINGKKLGHDWVVRDLRYKRRRKHKKTEFE
jgi:excisionase family DNA binding protein